MNIQETASGLEELCAAVNAAARLERAVQIPALAGILLPHGCHSIELHYDGSDVLAGYFHSTAVPPSLDATNVARLMSLCRLSSIRPDDEARIEKGILKLSGTPCATPLAKDASRG